MLKGALTWAIGFGLAVSVSAPFSAQAQGGIPVLGRWNISRPQRLQLIGRGAPVPLQFDTRLSQYSGTYRRMSPSFDELKLVGWWNNVEDRLLYLSVFPGTPRLNLGVWRPVYETCTSSLITPLNQEAGERDAALERYYRAKALYSLAGDNQCRGGRKEAVARAWFDRSYELMTLGECTISLNPEAANAYRQYDAAYVGRFVQRATGYRARCVNSVKNAMWERGDLRGAYSISRALVEALQRDRTLRAIIRDEQRLTLAVLSRERADLEQQLLARAGPTMTPAQLARDIAPAAIHLGSARLR